MREKDNKERERREMRARINYKSNTNYAAMRSFILDCMDEENSRNYDDDYKYNLYGDEFSRNEIENGYVEDVLSRYDVLKKDYEECEIYSYVDDALYVSKYYSFELA